MISFPNARINLGLNVVSKRPDGYHNIETIFYPIPVKDALEIVRADTFSFTQTGIPVDVPIEKNLVVKALNLLKSRYKIPELEVHLLKAIPFGAGLGGGSADAAFMSLNNSVPDVIVSDIAMPNVDGYAFMQKFKSMHFLKDGHEVPTLAVTAHAGGYSREKALGCGFNLHLTKPVSSGELVSAVATLAHRPALAG